MISQDNIKFLKDESSDDEELVIDNLMVKDGELAIKDDVKDGDSQKLNDEKSFRC